MHDYMEVGGTIPWKESVESSQEQRPRATHDYMEVGGRATQDAKAEEQLPTTAWMQEVE